ncbi:MAG: hypothetical protein K6F57_01305, partial [Candidatus Saccharibacteria bacterium]|nr:hypothetical protein [Candidatus Saccharibacteria bacterium]
MMEATCTYVSTEDLKRSPEELKKYRESGNVPVYEPILTSDARAILELASSYATGDVRLEDMQIECRENRGAELDFHSTKDVCICI